MGAKVVILGIDFSFHIPKSKDSSKEIMSEGELIIFIRIIEARRKIGMSQILIIKPYLLKVQNYYEKMGLELEWYKKYKT